jgi:hypothetical protein
MAAPGLLALSTACASAEPAPAVKPAQRVAFADLAIASPQGHCRWKTPDILQCAGRVELDGLRDKAIDGGGKRVEFLNINTGYGGVRLANAVNVTLSHLEIGWAGEDPAAATPAGAQRIYSFATVSACPAGQLGGVLQADLPLEGAQTVRVVSVWDPQTGYPWTAASPKESEVYFGAGANLTWTSGRSPCVPRLASLIGRRVLVRHPLGGDAAFHCVNCNTVQVENVRVTSGPGMAFVFGQGGSGLVLRNNVIAPRCSPRCSGAAPSAGQDGAHFAGVKGDILVEGNDFGWQGDDALNITGLMIPMQASGEQSGGGPWLTAGQAWTVRVKMLQPGGKLLLFDQGLSSLGETRILEVDNTGSRLRVAALPPGVSKFVVAGADFVPRRVVVRNNRFHDSSGRGILMGGSDGVVENNEISRLPKEAILVPADTGPWFEGPGAQNLTIRNNRISDVNRHPPAEGLYPSAISVGLSIDLGYHGAVGAPIRNIVIQDNSFTRIMTAPERPVSLGRGVQ